MKRYDFKMPYLQKNDFQILFKADSQNPFFIVYKPHGLASAPLKPHDDCALHRTAKDYPFIKSVCGKKKIEHGLLHRLDTATAGLLLIASTQESYDFLQKSQQNGQFIKKYTALCDNKKNQKTGFPPLPPEFALDTFTNLPLIIQSGFRSFGAGAKEVRPKIEKSQNHITAHTQYLTHIESFNRIEKNTYKIDVFLSRGFRHQIRSHLAWLGYPIIGDSVYNTNTEQGDLQLFAHTLEFLHPITEEILVFNY